jgi:hypothetical protein
MHLHERNLIPTGCVAQAQAVARYHYLLAPRDLSHVSNTRPVDRPRSGAARDGVFIIDLSPVRRPTATLIVLDPRKSLWAAKPLWHGRKRHYRWSRALQGQGGMLVLAPVPPS